MKTLSGIRINKPPITQRMVPLKVLIKRQARKIKIMISKKEYGTKKLQRRFHLMEKPIVLNMFLYGK